MKTKRKKSIKFLRKQLLRAINTMSLILKPKYNLAGCRILLTVSVIDSPDSRLLSVIYVKNIYVAEIFEKSRVPLKPIKI